MTGIFLAIGLAFSGWLGYRWLSLSVRADAEFSQILGREQLISELRLVLLRADNAAWEFRTGGNPGADERMNNEMRNWYRLIDQLLVIYPGGEANRLIHALADEGHYYQSTFINLVSESRRMDTSDDSGLMAKWRQTVGELDSAPLQDSTGVDHMIEHFEYVANEYVRSGSADAKRNYLSVRQRLLDIAPEVREPLNNIHRLFQELDSQRALVDKLHGEFRTHATAMAVNSMMLVKMQEDAFKAYLDFRQTARHDLLVQTVLAGLLLATLFAIILFEAERKMRLMRELEYRATHDALTGLLNRTEIERLIGVAMDDARERRIQYAFCYIDLDNFKVINDSCGHAAGDEALIRVTQLLRRFTGDLYSLGRLGGDEFGVLLREYDGKGAMLFAKGLADVLRDYRFVWGNHVFSMGCSVGIAMIPDHGDSTSMILQRADIACFHAKESGRNTVCLWEESESDAAGESGVYTLYQSILLIPRIQRALEQDTLELMAQPIVPLGKACDGLHFEVLVRMREEGRLIPPGGFLPAAERYDLIQQIDRWVMEQTFASLREAIHKGIKISCCEINLSGPTLSDRNVEEWIRDGIIAHGLPPEMLCFEITETAAISNFNKAQKMMRSLKEIGCRFALDDFGSGMSSFGYLQEFPLDILKIDGSFIRDLADNRLHREIIKAMVAIARYARLKTVGEFTETQEICALLADMGVDYAQGYAVGRPVALSDLLYSPSSIRRVVELR